MKTPALLAFLSAMLVLPACVHRPGHEFRSINTDRYELSIQRRGAVDISLLAGEPVFENVVPMVWLDGDDAPRSLRMEGDSTARWPVSDALGEGQGLVVPGRNSEWRLNTYPVQPFLTARLEYVNTGSEPVHVRALLPWSLRNGDGRFSLGPGSDRAQVLTAETTETRRPAKLEGGGASEWYLAAYNSSTRRSAIAGFLTQRYGENRVTLQRSDEDQQAYGRFEAATVFDPPVELQPGEAIESEMFYIGIAEDSPFRGLERFANATAVFNRVRRDDTLKPDAWNAWPREVVEEMDEAAFLEEADYAERLLQPYGWEHFQIGLGWETAKGDWQGDPARFPDGMGGLAAKLQEKGFTPALEITPLIVSADSELAQAHPEWLLEPNAEGAERLAPDQRILDISQPGARERLRQMIARVTREWGFEVITGDPWLEPLYWVESFGDSAYTRAQLATEAALIIREAAGPRTYIAAAGYGPVPALYSRGMRVGPAAEPQWRTGDPANPGVVESLQDAALRYNLAPFLWQPSHSAAYFGNGLELDQSLAWFTAQALTGGTVALGNRFTDLGPAEAAILQRLVPNDIRAARPLDLFDPGEPRIWSTAADDAAGPLQLAAVFNWDATTANQTSLYMTQLGLNPNRFYTVYDFWENHYHGTAQRMLTVTIPPGAVRLFGFRPLEERPMFIAVDSHFSQGANDVTEVEWDAGQRRLHGVLEAKPDATYTIRLRVPEGFTMNAALVDGEETDWRMEGNIAALAFETTDAGPVRWEAAFD